MKSKSFENKQINYRLMSILSIFGLTAGIIMFIGDMFFYYKPISGKDFNPVEIMEEKSIKNLIIGGSLGPIAGILYALGSVLFYYAFKLSQPLLAKIITSCWVIMFVVGGTYHAIYPNYGFVAKLPEEFRGEQINYVSMAINSLYNIAFVFGIVSSLLISFLILFKKSPFPKWTVLFIPTFLTLLNDTITPLIPYPLGAVVSGGWVNICFILYFAICFAIFYREANTKNT